MPDEKIIAGLWAVHPNFSDPQFVGAVSESLYDAWSEETDRIRDLAEQWFCDFGDEARDEWKFKVVFHRIPIPRTVESVASSQELKP